MIVCVCTWYIINFSYIQGYMLHENVLWNRCFVFCRATYIAIYIETFFFCTRAFIIKWFTENQQRKDPFTRYICSIKLYYRRHRPETRSIYCIYTNLYRWYRQKLLYSDRNRSKKKTVLGVCDLWIKTALLLLERFISG